MPLSESEVKKKKSKQVWPPFRHFPCKAARPGALLLTSYNYFGFSWDLPLSASRGERFFSWFAPCGECWGRAKGAAKASCGETVVQKGVFGEFVSSLPPLRGFKGCFKSKPEGGKRRNGLSKNTLLDNRFSAWRLRRSFGALWNVEDFSWKSEGPNLRNVSPKFRCFLGQCLGDAPEQFKLRYV